jgi:hypothetical protein
MAVYPLQETCCWLLTTGIIFDIKLPESFVSSELYLVVHCVDYRHAILILHLHEQSLGRVSVKVILKEMPPTSRRVLRVKGKEKVTASNVPSTDCALSMTNFLAGGDLLVPKSRTWAMKRSDTSTRQQTILVVDSRDSHTSDDDSSNVPASSSTEGGSNDISEGDDSEQDSSRVGKAKHSPARTQNRTNARVKKKATVLDSGRYVCLKRKTKARGKPESTDIDDAYEADRSEKDGVMKCKKMPKSKTKPKKMETETSSAGSVTPGTSVAEEAEDKAEPGSSEDEAAQTAGGRNEKTQTAAGTNEATQTSGASTKDDNDWTPSQDAIILSMKEGDETWASIGKAIGRGKKDVQKRWKELSAESRSIHIAVDTSDGDGASAEDNVRRRATSSSGQTDDSSEQQRKIVDMLAAQCGEPGKSVGEKMVADENFSALDCQVLSLLEVKHKVQRWLELQAGFFNATGRMVPVEMLRRKLGEAIDE